MNDILGNVSRETIDQLRTYEALVQKWTPQINLVSKDSIPFLWERHILDSVQVFNAAPAGFAHWADIGSGGGFPGIVVAVLAADLPTAPQITLIESDARKAVFLRTALREIGVPGRVIHDRIEAVPPLGADVISARALANLTTLIELSAPHLHPDGVALFPKGARWQEEVESAKTKWNFRCTAITSKLEESAAILRIEGVARV